MTRYGWPLWLPNQELAGIKQPWTQEGTIEALIEVSRKAPIDRRGFTVLTGTALTTLALQSMNDPEPLVSALQGKSVAPVVADQLEQQVASARLMDDSMGGEQILICVASHLGIAINLLKTGSYTETMGRRLCGLAAEAARLAGWLSFSINRHAAAQQYFLAGLRAAHTAGDRGISGHILAVMSYQAAMTGNPHDAVALIQASQNGLTNASNPTVLALVAAREAQAQAKAGNASECQEALDRAFETYERLTSQQHTPAWAYYVDEAFLNAQAGRALLDLDDARRAEKYLRTAMAQTDQSFVQARCVYLSRLAVAQLRQHDLEQACALGLQAIQLANNVNSDHCIDNIRELRRELAPYEGAPSVRDFTEQTRELLSGS